MKQLFESPTVEILRYPSEDVLGSSSDVWVDEDGVIHFPPVPAP